METPNRVKKPIRSRLHPQTAENGARNRTENKGTMHIQWAHPVDKLHKSIGSNLIQAPGLQTGTPTAQFRQSNTLDWGYDSHPGLMGRRYGWRFHTRLLKVIKVALMHSKPRHLADGMCPLKLNGVMPPSKYLVLFLYFETK